MNEVLRVEHAGLELGTLTREPAGIVFEASRAWIVAGPELSPVVPLCKPGKSRCNLPDLLGLHGVFYNSLPDRWGTRLMEEEFRARGLSYPTTLDRLAYVGRHGMGSLVFRPELETFGRDAAAVLDVAEAARAARHIEAHGADAAAMREIFGGNATAGGARPKINVRRLASGGFTTELGAESYGESGDAFILKFETGARIERVEHALMRLARATGLRVADTEQVADGDLRHLLVRRFDRDGDRRFHCPTLYALTEGNYRSTDFADYLDLADASKKLRCGDEAVFEILIRALFNRIVGNLDDHHKNHAFRLTDAGWELAPAYDITHQSGTRHSLRFCGRSEVGEGSVAGEFAAVYKLPWERVVAGMRTLRAALDRWPEFAAAAGVPANESASLGELMRSRANLILDETPPVPVKMRGRRVRL